MTTPWIDPGSAQQSPPRDPRARRASRDHRTVLAWGAGLVVSIAMVVLGWTPYNQARSELALAEQTSSELRTLVSELVRTRATLPPWMLDDGLNGRPPTTADREDLGARLASALTSCGLAASTLASVAPEAPAVLAQSALAGSTPEVLPAAPRASLAGSAARLPTRSAIGNERLRLIRRRAVATLDPITLPQLGRFLDTLREREPRWSIATIDLAPLPVGKASPLAQRGGDAPLHAVIALERDELDRR